MSWRCPPPLCGCTHSAEGNGQNGWDAGISWRTIRSVDPVDVPIEVAYMREKVLRVVNDSVEDGHISNLIWEATEEAEEATQRALMPQTWQMVLSAFPAGDIVLERPPLIAVTSFEYVDGDGNDQTLAVSPPAFQVISSGKYAKARLRVLSGESWPSIWTGSEVTITYEAGYANDQDIQLRLISRGIALMVSEMYKQRELSVVGTSIVPAPLDLTRFWRKVY